jgi:hypothetical protein
MSEYREQIYVPEISGELKFHGQRESIALALLIALFESKSLGVTSGFDNSVRFLESMKDLGLVFERNQNRSLFLQIGFWQPFTTIFSDIVGELNIGLLKSYSNGSNMLGIRHVQPFQSGRLRERFMLINERFFIGPGFITHNQMDIDCLDGQHDERGGDFVLFSNRTLAMPASSDSRKNAEANLLIAGFNHLFLAD